MKKFSKDEYLRSLTLKSKINLGIKDTGDWSLHSVNESNSSIFAGGMGSGKSLAGVFSVYSFLKNNYNGLVIGLDPHKGLNDYTDIKSKRIKVFKNDKNHIAKTIKLIFNEMQLRKKICQQENVKNISELPNIKLSPILYLIEEFSSVVHYIDWMQFHSIDGTIANNLKMILKDGGNFGINILAITQGIKSDHLPLSLFKFFINKRFFYFGQDSKIDLENLLGFSNLNITFETRGRAVDEFNCKYQFLLLQNSFLEKNPISDGDVFLLNLKDFNDDVKENTDFFEKLSLKDFILE